MNKSKKSKKILFILSMVLVFVAATIGSYFLMGKSNVYYDKINFLPNKSENKQTYNILVEEFGEGCNLTIMNVNLSESFEPKVLTFFYNQEIITDVTINKKDIYTLYNINFNLSSGSQEVCDFIEEVSTFFVSNNIEYYMMGESFISYEEKNMLNKDIPIILFILIPFAFVLILLFTNSYIEPLIYILVLIVSLLISQGTNALLPNVSYISNSLAAILQFALCMNYGLVMLNNFFREKRLDNQNNNSEYHLKKAWKKSLNPILTSSLTTIAGLTALMFMSYRIGVNMGLVLIKGVIITTITILFLLPALILLFDKLLTLTQHKSFFSIFKRKDNKPIKEKTQKSINSRNVWNYFLGFGFFIFSITSLFVFTTSKTFVYDFSAANYEDSNVTINKEKITSVFGTSENIIFLHSREFTPEKLETFKKNTSVFFNTMKTDEDYYLNVLSLENKMSKEQILSFINIGEIDESYIDFVLEFLNVEEASFEDLIFVLEELEVKKTSLQMKEQLNISGLVSILLDDIFDVFIKTQKASYIDLIDFLNTKYSSQDFNTKFNVTLSKTPYTSSDIYKYINNSSTSEGEFSFLGFLFYTILDNNSKYVGLFNTLNSLDYQKVNELSNGLKTKIKTIFISENYQRIIFTHNIDDKDFELLLVNQIKRFGEINLDDVHVLTPSFIIDEIRTLAPSDELKVLIISITFIFLILLFFFKSPIIAIILIFLIQGANYINLTIPVLLNQEIIFLGYLIVNSILLGATIDFAVLYTNYFYANNYDVKKTREDFLPVITISSLIIIVAGFLLMIISNNPFFAFFGRMLCIGTLIITLSVLFILPIYLTTYQNIKNKKLKKEDI